MFQSFDLELNDPDLRGVRCLVCRPKLPANGDIESGFLDRASAIRRHPPGRAIAQSLLNVAEAPNTEVIAVIRNPKLVVDGELPQRIAAARRQLATLQPWAVAAAGGLGLGDKRHLALYASKSPLIPLPGGPKPVIDVMPDFYLVDAAFARSVLSTGPLPAESAVETVLVIEGYLDGKVSVALPGLTAGIDGDLLARDLISLTSNLCQRFSDQLGGQTLHTLTGGIQMDPGPELTAPQSVSNLADRIARTVDAGCAPPSLSVVTRTRFERPHLLRRLLTSISRARHDGIDVEVVLSSDAPLDLCEDAVRELRETFVNLRIRLAHNVGSGPSRVINLIEGLRAAANDYVLAIDDDDYLDIFAFEHMLPAFFAGNRPLVIGSSEVHEETWEYPSQSRPVLAHSEPVRSYPAHGWRGMFSGVNKLPICAIAAPRTFVQARLSGLSLSHDLSEDYALFLLLLTAPDLPEIHEIDDTICHISLHGSDNSVTMPDRRPWVRDICGHLSTLTHSSGVTGPGTWAVLAALSHPQAVEERRSIEDLRDSLERRDTDVRVLQREASRLRGELAILVGGAE